VVANNSKRSSWPWHWRHAVWTTIAAPTNTADLHARQARCALRVRAKTGRDSGGWVMTRNAESNSQKTLGMGDTADRNAALKTSSARRTMHMK